MQSITHSNRARLPLGGVLAGLVAALAIVTGCAASTGAPGDTASAATDDDAGAQVGVQCADGRAFTGTPEAAASFCASDAGGPAAPATDAPAFKERMVHVICCGATCSGTPEGCAELCRLLCEEV